MFRFVLFLAMVGCMAGCAVQHRESGALFDQLRGRGPVIIDRTNDTRPSTRFFQDTWSASTAIKHLVSTRGAPDALSVEREFLRPNRLKLFYPTEGQVYILDSVDGEWFVAGSEPVQAEDLQTLREQRAEQGVAAQKAAS
jgi:hypothetical protein